MRWGSGEWCSSKYASSSRLCAKTGRELVLKIVQPALQPFRNVAFCSPEKCSRSAIDSQTLAR